MVRAADHAAAETAAIRSPARSEGDGAAEAPAIISSSTAGERQAEGATALGAPAAAAATHHTANSIGSSPTVAEPDLEAHTAAASHLQPSQASDAAKYSEGIDASAYAASALAENTADDQPGAAISEVAAAAAVDWRLVASQAQGSSPLTPATGSPHGAVARLRAIFEQSR